MKRILMTGGAGRVAKYLIPEMKEKYKLRIFDVKEPDNGNFEFYKGDIENLKDLEKATDDCDGIIHLAAIPLYNGDDEKIWKVNFDGTFNVIEAAKINSVKHIIFTSSICAWGAINWTKPFDFEYLPVDEKVHLVPEDAYGLGKLLGELLHYVYYRRYGIKSISLRLATVGFHDQDYWIQARKHIDKPDYHLEGAPLTLKDLIWNYVDPRDLAQAYSLAMEALINGKVEYGVYNVGAEDVFSTVETIDLIRTYYPNVRIIHNESHFLDNRFSALFSIDKAKKELGYKPKYTWRDFNPQ